jgi:intracellular sulfur oxidation DsrE/DsrF family protein
MKGRRFFLSRLGAGAGFATLLGAESLRAQSASEARWQPTRHPQDDWYDQVPGQHRLVFDTTSPDGLGTGLQFANNFFAANKSGYGLEDNDVAVVMVVRHKSTAFGFNDAIWKKYGMQLSKQANDFLDPKTKEAPIVNVYATAGGRMDNLIKKGAHVAICQMATRAISNTLARSTGGSAEEIYGELSENLVTNGHLAAAGILAVNRAQERGYALCHAG